MATFTNTMCGFPLQKPDVDGNIRLCTNKITKTKPDGTECCGVHVKSKRYQQPPPPPPPQPPQCSICLDDYNKNTITLHCTHSFHKDCVTQWFNTGKKTCPLCRAVTKLTPIIIREFEDRVYVIERQLEKIEKISYHDLSDYWKEKVDNLEEEVVTLIQLLECEGYHM